MKHTMLLALAIASTTVFAQPAMKDSTIHAGATVRQSGDECYVQLQYVDSARSAGVDAPVVKRTEANKKCAQFVVAGLLANENGKLVFTARAKSMTASELNAAVLRLPD